MSDDPRRLGIFWVSEQALVDLLAVAKGTRVEVHHALPEGAAVVSVHHDWRRRAWGVVVEHESMPPDVPGNHIPWVGNLSLRLEAIPPDAVREIEDATQPPRPATRSWTETVQIELVKYLEDQAKEAAAIDRLAASDAFQAILKRHSEPQPDSIVEGA